MSTEINESYIEQLSAVEPASAVFMVETPSAPVVQPSVPPQAQGIQPPQVSDRERQLEQELAMYRQFYQQHSQPQPAAQPAAPAAPPQPERLFDFSRADWKSALPQEAMQHGAAVDVIGNVVQAMLAHAVEPAIQARLAEMRAQQELLAVDNERVFANSLAGLSDEVRAAQSNPAWNTYLASQVPLTNITVKDALETAFRNRDVNKMREVIEHFTRTTGAPPRQSVMPQGNSMPFNTGAPHAAKAEMIPESAILKAARDAARGQINQATYDALEAKYKQAVAEGRILRGQ